MSVASRFLGAARRRLVLVAICLAMAIGFGAAARARIEVHCYADGFYQIIIYDDVTNQVTGVIWGSGNNTCGPGGGVRVQ